MNDHIYMNELTPSQEGIVIKIHARDEILRRFFDLGLVEGTKIKCIGTSPFGDPSAYLIRGAVIAIRADDCQGIIIKKEDGYERYRT